MPAFRAAVQQHRLAPGPRPAEEQVSELTSVSRTAIWKVLNRLAHEGLMTLVQNRGAFIASPGVTLARDVFVTRRMIEPRMLSATATQTQIRTLQQHSKKEEEARAKDDRTPTDE